MRTGRPAKPERLWEKVDKQGPIAPGLGRCWVYTGGLDKAGYGQFWFQGRNDRAHRASWILTNGPIPEGEGYHGTCVLHQCDRPRCVRPSHLFLGSSRDNIEDMDRKGRRVVGVRRRGEDCYFARLTEADVRAIRESYTGRYGELSQLARRYGVTHPTVRAAVLGQTWKHLLSQE